ncbi:MAG TPA: NusG domain II-containing protein [Candidatus Alectryocaccomicrobium excrementavium]|uniref:NusG domain II-containing protein n=1 Tax=Candidatus Alectryocaccomicrobium excrementavium TaxID=2840668 RepID=A0A9D1G174_9FIRM|nr:NusG domain II-containing protein [Candidatus Alectryocaccomicrobium excrementavium]
MKKGDGLLIAALAAVSLLAFCLLPAPSGATLARLKVDGETVCEIAGGAYRWEAGDAYLEFCFEDGRARVLASSCPDQICVQSGEVSGAGRSIICLPNRAVIELTGPGAADAVV